MLAMYWKARVWLSVEKLAKYLNLPIVLVDDADTSFQASDYEAIIPTPGVNPSSRAWQGGNVMSELDFSYQFLPKGFKICAITGTDGKSTTTWIVYEMLRKYAQTSDLWEVFISGNFEDSFAKTVQEIRERGLTKGVVVLEVSSFMAYGIGRSRFPGSVTQSLKRERDGVFHADVTIFTNFETDHINWHGSMREYLDAKVNLLRHTTHTCFIEHSIVTKSADLQVELPNTCVSFGKDHSLQNRFEQGEVIINNAPAFTLAETNFSGEHNGFNFLSWTLASHTLGVPIEFIRRVLGEIHGLPHRLEFVAQKGEIRYIDDSKSTSAQSLRAALESFEGKKLLLIAGGSDKGDVFQNLEPLIRSRVTFLVAIGATKDAFIQLAKSSEIPYTSTDSMSEAVQECIRHARAGDTVLLSPGCASFGLFRDYLDRAEQFRHAVEKFS